MKSTVLSLLLIAPLLTVQAQTPAPSELLAKTQIHKIVNINGQETFVATPVMALDDTVQYTTDYYNNTTSPLYNIRVTFAVPPHMKMIGLSPEPSNAKVRDQAHSNWQSYPVYIKDKGVRALPIGHYSELAWVIPRLDPKQTTRMTIRAQLVERPTLPGNH